MIKLIYFEPSDFDQLIQWIDSPKLNLQWGGPTFNYPLTKEQLKDYIKDANSTDSKLYVYKAVLKDSGKTVGHISLGNIDQVNRSARIGRVLIGDKTVRGKGLGQLMIQEILKQAFEELMLHRVSLGVFDFNQSAIACYEKAGFQKEGLLRDCRRLGNEYWSLWEMSILESEYHPGN